ncbi:MAG TPA: OmpH family outer membrane protein [Tepidisphaeraceae bacterium]|nr:OmpH family outer membrane protein [Tepidisphaeraceae bacterium]
MKLSHCFVISLLALGLFAMPSLAQSAPRIAIANTARILNELQETKDLNQKINNDLKLLDTERVTRQQKVTDLQAKRDQLRPEAPQYNDVNKEWLQARIEFEIWAQLQQANLQREQKIQMRTLFGKIEQTIAEVATKKAIDVVLAEQKVDFPDNLDAIQVDQLKAIIGQRNVLFANAATVDITNDVITAMDAAYKAGN